MAEDPEARAQARQEELAKLAEFQVYREVPLDRVPRGAQWVSLRWVDTVKPGGVLKSRLVAREFNTGARTMCSQQLLRQLH